MVTPPPTPRRRDGLGSVTALWTPTGEQGTEIRTEMGTSAGPLKLSLPTQILLGTPQLGTAFSLSSPPRLLLPCRVDERPIDRGTPEPLDANMNVIHWMATWSDHSSNEQCPPGGRNTSRKLPRMWYQCFRLIHKKKMREKVKG